uniref:bromo adjacent homology domain-containing 1 protein n=1 Tax=Gasterosteus aculeatus aculeatus TaxID=481459 RepID=UPI001A99D7CB|nr:bromo adjacent homology domain-containing 1 protein [Gasterosteus aculeatus aculeatus]XP_040017135.1 bromo adjacent homology domain-containing 1 protein [Gasterosteus aculeatus aculeatus]
MTHARQKGSLGGAAERRDSRHLWTQGGAMGDAAPERSLRFGRTKKIAEVIRKRKVAAKRAGGKKGRTERSDQNRKLDRRRDHKRDRKSYPLRGRPAGSEEEEEEEEGLSCHVLLTRLEESVREREGSGERAPVRPRPKKLTSIKRKAAKSSPKTGPESSSRGGAECLGVPPPRKRRLASLNAEAVNSLLLERATETQAAAKQARRQAGPPNAGTSLHANPGGPADAKAARRNAGKTPASRGHGRRQSSERAQKAEANRAAAAVSQESLDAPAPRRLAGLNAAALLKLTSSSATSKQRVKNAPAATVASKRPTRVRRKGRPQGQRGGEAAPPRGGGCAACETEADFQPAAGWDTRRLTKPGYQSRGVLAYPLKPVKEEPLETDLSPYYCCPPESSVEYCHRLAFFLGQRPCGGASAAAPPPPLPSAAAPVKRECLVTSPHAALTLSPHPCLCTAEHCFSSYYVHIAHPARAGTTSAGLASRPLNFAPAGLCPDRVAAPKLLGPHPACCYGEACGMGGYACRAMAPVASRGCSFSAGCAGCTRGIKTEGYSSPQGDHSPFLLPLPALPLSSCPLSAAPSSTQTRPHLLTPLSGRDRPQARLKLASECPRGNGPAAGSLTVGRAGLTHKQQQQPPPPPPPSLGAAKQRRVGRRRATNGWRPVGTPTEREVFIAGEDETAPRQCYEGVERDGEVIHIRDTVLLRSGPRKKSLPYVAKISALWEDPKTGELMMSLFWYYRPEHTQGGRDPSAHCENEIFASRHQDENSVACIEDRCYVLPLAQYCRFCALVRRRAEGAPPGSASVVPCRPDFAPPLHRCVPTDVDPELVYLCRHVYDFRFGRILKNLQ